MFNGIVTPDVHWHCDSRCTLTVFVVLDACEVQTDSSPAINSAYLKCHKYHVIFSSDMVLCLMLKNSCPYNTLAIWIDVGWRTWYTYSHIMCISSQFSGIHTVTLRVLHHSLVAYIVTLRVLCHSLVAYVQSVTLCHSLVMCHLKSENKYAFKM